MCTNEKMFSFDCIFDNGRMNKKSLSASFFVSVVVCVYTVSYPHATYYVFSKISKMSIFLSQNSTDRVH